MLEKKEKVLVVDDSPDTLEMLARKIASRGYEVYSAPDVSKALDTLGSIPIELVITDYKMPKHTGLELIRHIQSNLPHIKVIMLTGFPTIEGAVEAVKVGAEEYLTKPFTDDELFSAVDTAIRKLRQKKLSVKPAAQESNPYGIIGASKEIQKVFHSIRKSCSTNATVLVQGESGTGKELVARAIHYHSKRSKTPFVPVNCGAIPDSLLEAELFGFTKGSFTGAHETRAGYFLTADGGTIFLDEISETSLSMQVKLLRVLEDKQIYMIGTKKPRSVNVRVIAATNKDLQLLVKQGYFREDLYYRLNVLTINIPALRDRSEDIPALIYHFLNKFATENAKKIPEIADNALSALQSYQWQGNVRELENLIYRLVIMKDDQIIDLPDLPDYIRYSIKIQKDLNRSLEDVEREYIMDVVKHVGGNKSLAAKILKIDRKTLHAKMRPINKNEDTDAD
ncbi:MAG: sigma-54 dependent transcriptional regulator [Candidatus Cloacimonetes bacterium]|nr:sigma-54 dependent transcriptional regulator [Candidatus Cloacimonadota bacterium]